MGCANSTEQDAAAPANRRSGGRPTDSAQDQPLERVDLTRAPSKSAFKNRSAPARRRVSWATDDELKRTAEDIMREESEKEAGTSNEAGGDRRLPHSPLMRNERSLIQAAAEAACMDEDRSAFDDEPPKCPNSISAAESDSGPTKPEMAAKPIATSVCSTVSPSPEGASVSPRSPPAYGGGGGGADDVETFTAVGASSGPTNGSSAAGNYHHHARQNPNGRYGQPQQQQQLQQLQQLHQPSPAALCRGASTDDVAEARQSPKAKVLNPLSGAAARAAA